jgi:hypothetical protein
MYLDEWRPYLQVVTVVGSASVGGGIHEYGDWEVAGGGQEKTLRPLLK